MCVFRIATFHHYVSGEMVVSKDKKDHNNEYCDDVFVIISGKMSVEYTFKSKCIHGIISTHQCINALWSGWKRQESSSLENISKSTQACITMNCAAVEDTSVLRIASSDWMEWTKEQNGGEMKNIFHILLLKIERITVRSLIAHFGWVRKQIQYI